jgi:hypothetical protein
VDKPVTLSENQRPLRRSALLSLLRRSSGNRAILMAIRRASSFASIFCLQGLGRIVATTCDGL